MTKLVEALIGDKWYKVAVPDDAPESSYKYGLRIGPPDFEDMLGTVLGTKLHNELYHRGLITERDVMSHTDWVLGAWQSVLKSDVSQIIDRYRQKTQ